MIKEGKQRIIVTLEEPIARHLEIWLLKTNQAINKTKTSRIITEALKEWMEKRGETFDGWER